LLVIEAKFGPVGTAFGVAADANRRGLAVAHEDTDYVVPLASQQMGRDARIDTATHGQNNARHNGSLGPLPPCDKDGLAAVLDAPYNDPPRRLRLSDVLDTHSPEKDRQFPMEKEHIDRAKAIRQSILQLRDSL
jgi:hypothetical protein